MQLVRFERTNGFYRRLKQFGCIRYDITVSILIYSLGCDFCRMLRLPKYSLHCIVRCLHSENVIILKIVDTLMNIQICGRQTALISIQSATKPAA